MGTSSRLVGFQSTRPAWGATYPRNRCSLRWTFQSTRPAWGATAGYLSSGFHSVISIHAPRVGRDERDYQDGTASYTFQSTRPAWGATAPYGDNSGCKKFQSTRPAWGATSVGMRRENREVISIHAPRVGRDEAMLSPGRRRRYFNPRAPRGARLDVRAGDVFQPYFNPRAPRGARLHRKRIVQPTLRFQSTRPAWGATTNVGFSTSFGLISIHAPRVGRD